VPTALALGVTATLIGGSVLLSLIKTRSEEPARKALPARVVNEEVSAE